jgi:hypothetical protein
VALIALLALILRPRLGGVDAIIAGVVMIACELVEIAVIGFTATQEPTQPQSWLQVLYLMVGAALVILGARLWILEYKTAPRKITQ